MKRAESGGGAEKWVHKVGRSWCTARWDARSSHCFTIINSYTLIRPLHIVHTDASLFGFFHCITGFNKLRKEINTSANELTRSRMKTPARIRPVPCVLATTFRSMIGLHQVEYARARFIHIKSTTTIRMEQRSLLFKKTLYPFLKRGERNMVKTIQELICSTQLTRSILIRLKTDWNSSLMHCYVGNNQVSVLRRQHFSNVSRKEENIGL